MEELVINDQNIDALNKVNDNITSITYTTNMYTDKFSNIFIRKFKKYRNNFINLESLVVTINCYDYDMFQYEKLAFLFCDDKIKKIHIYHMANLASYITQFSIIKENDYITMTAPYHQNLELSKLFFVEVNTLNLITVQEHYPSGIFNFSRINMQIHMVYKGRYVYTDNVRRLIFNLKNFNEIPLSIKKINFITSDKYKFYYLGIFDNKIKIPFNVQISLTINDDGGTIYSIVNDFNENLIVYHNCKINEELYINKKLIFIKDKSIDTTI